MATLQSTWASVAGGVASGVPKLKCGACAPRRGMKLGNFSFVEEPLGLGAAGGNQFDIVLRGVTGATPQQVPLAVGTQGVCVEDSEGPSHAVQLQGSVLPLR